MKINPKTWEFSCFLKIAILQTILLELAVCSVLPRPNIRHRSTTQISNLEKNYSAEGTIVIVTSSELPKQIPPPPTPTKPHRPTPKYDFSPTTKEWLYKGGLHDKDLPAYHVPYALNNLNSFHNPT